MPGKKSKALPILFVSTLTCVALTISPLRVNADANSDLQNSRSELNQMQSDMQSLADSYQSTLNQARQTEQQVSDLMAKNKALHQEIAQTNQQIQDRDRLFKERIKVMYEDGDVSYLSVLLDSKDFSDFLDRLDMLTLIVQQDHNLITQLQAEHTTLETQQKQLTSQQQDMESKQNQLWALESTLQSQMKEKQSQITVKQQEVQQNEQAVAAAQAAAQAALIQQNTSSSPTSLPSRGEVSLSPSAPYMMMVATAYTAPQNSYTASGTAVGVGTVAVDPSVIPLGTKLYIEGYGYAIASDTGDAIKGNRIDLFFNSIDQCIFFGRQVVKVYKVS